VVIQSVIINTGTVLKPRGEQAGVDTSKLLLLQRNAVNSILQCRDFTYILRGYAGASKRQIHASLIASGKNPLYLAPTRGAVKVLQDDGFENATTVASFMNKPEIPKDTVLIVDESILHVYNIVILMLLIN
jgi:hypothetical protein